jgi:hypothetical protein
MTYQIKDQDVTPPKLDPAQSRSVTLDGFAAVVMALSALGLIILILSQVID